MTYLFKYCIFYIQEPLLFPAKCLVKNRIIGRAAVTVQRALDALVTLVNGVQILRNLIPVNFNIKLIK